MSSLWVADDGSFGTGDVEVIDSTDWTEDDWDAFEEASDWERLYVARQIMWDKEEQ